MHVTPTAAPEGAELDQADRAADDLTDGHPSDAGAPSGPGPRADTGAPRVTGRRLLLTTVVATAVLIAAVVVGVSAHHHLQQTRSSLASTRAELRHTLAQVAVARAQLTAASGRAETAAHGLASATAQLAADQARLARAQADVFAKGVSISQLDTCLAGVEAALNQISLGDQSGAGASLSGVAAHCRAAEPSP